MTARSHRPAAARTSPHASEPAKRAREAAAVWLRMAVLAALTLASLPAQAQIVIDVPGRADIPLAAPRPQTPEGDPRRTAEEAWQTLLADLRLSGYFLVLDPAAYIERGGGVEPDTFEWSAWAPLRTAVLVKTRLLPPGNAECDPTGQATCLDVFVYHAAGNTLLAKKRLRSSTDSARYLGHRAADMVLEAVTGQKGIFGSRIAAVSKQGGNKELMLVDIDGKGVVSITRNGSINLSPSFAPDGGSVAWTSYKKGNPDVYVKELATGRTRVISNKLGVNVSPSWSPDGTRIAVARTGEADSDIAVLDARTGALLKQVTRGGGIDVSPDWSPDGSMLVFASERSGGSQLYTYEMTSAALARITHTGDFNIDPVFSPDGSEIAFVSRETGGFDIYVIGADGRNIRRITQDAGDNEDPSWSPDGRYLVFSSTRNGRSEIWLSTADGRHQAPVTRSGGWSQPTWAR
ncbi:MAG: TolB protein [Myxococcota bacterium]|jgi:TolB protein